MFKLKRKNTLSTQEVFDYIELEIYKALRRDGERDNLINIEPWLEESKKQQQKEQFYHEIAILNRNINMLSTQTDYDNFYDTGDIFGHKVNGGVITNNGQFVSIPGLKVKPGESTFANVFEERSKNY